MKLLMQFYPPFCYLHTHTHTHKHTHTMGMAWINLAQGFHQWWNLVTIAINFRMP